MSYRSLLLVCLAMLGLAVAGWGQADSKIAFISDREGHGDVWIMNADGSDPVNLTQGRDCISPAWSPDGAKIAYISDVFDDDQYGGEIWLMDADGGNPQQLTDDSVDRIRLSWSADGSSIYYTEWTTSTSTFVMALDGSGSSPVDWREAPYNGHNRSPDGTKEAVVVLREKGDEVNLARFYVSDVRENEPSVFSIFHEPTSRGVDASVFLQRIRAELSVIPLPDLDQSGLCVRESPDSFRTWYGQDGVCVSDDTWLFFHTWAPNSMRIAFSDFTDFIWAVDIDGSNLVELTNGLGGHSPAWQPVVPSSTSVESQSWGRIKSLLSTGSPSISPRP